MIGMGQLIASLFGGGVQPTGLPSGIGVTGVNALGGFNPSPMTPGITASGEAGPPPAGISVGNIGTLGSMPRTGDLMGALGGLRGAAAPAAPDSPTFAPWGRRRGLSAPIQMQTAAQLFR